MKLAAWRCHLNGICQRADAFSKASEFHQMSAHFQQQLSQSILNQHRSRVHTVVEAVTLCQDLGSPREKKTRTDCVSYATLVHSDFRLLRQYVEADTPLYYLLKIQPRSQ